MFRRLDAVRSFTKKQHPALQYVLKTLAIVLGTAIVLTGIAMLALPGPGILTILLGLGIISIASESFSIHLEHKFNQFKAILIRYRDKIRKKKPE